MTLQVKNSQRIVHVIGGDLRDRVRQGVVKVHDRNAVVSLQSIEQVFVSLTLIHKDIDGALQLSFLYFFEAGLYYSHILIKVVLQLSYCVVLSCDFLLQSFP